jgi:hypothetical protein
MAEVTAPGYERKPHLHGCADVFLGSLHYTIGLTSGVNLRRSLDNRNRTIEVGAAILDGPSKHIGLVKSEHSGHAGSAGKTGDEDPLRIDAILLSDLQRTQDSKPQSAASGLVVPGILCSNKNVLMNVQFCFPSCRKRTDLVAGVNKNNQTVWIRSRIARGHMNQVAFFRRIHVVRNVRT